MWKPLTFFRSTVLMAHVYLGTDSITVFPPEQSLFIVILEKSQNCHRCRAPVLLELQV